MLALVTWLLSCLSGFSPVVTLLSPFPYCPLWEEVAKEWELLVASIRAGLLRKLLGILCRQACSSPRSQSFQSLISICTCGYVLCTLDYNPVLLLYLLLSCTSCGRCELFHLTLPSLWLNPVSVLRFAALSSFLASHGAPGSFWAFPAQSQNQPFLQEPWCLLVDSCARNENLSSGLHTRPAFTFSHHMPQPLLVPVCSFYKTAQIWFLELSGF